MKTLATLALVAASLIANPVRAAESSREDSAYGTAGYITVYVTKCDANIPLLTKQAAIVIFRADNDRAMTATIKAQEQYEKYGHDAFCIATKAFFAELL